VDEDRQDSRQLILKTAVKHLLFFHLKPNKTDYEQKYWQILSPGNG
jgi:hypothetical protein